MNKTKIVRLSILVFILIALFIMTTSVWADTNMEKPVEEPKASIPRKAGYRVKVLELNKTFPPKDERDCRVIFPSCVCKRLGCQCTRQPQ